MMSSLNFLGMFRCQLRSERGLLGRGLQISAIATAPKKKTKPEPKKKKYLMLYPEFNGPLPPKRWKNPYLVYAEERYKVLGSVQDNTKGIAAEWKKMSADQKKEYELKSQKYREDYSRKLREVLQSVGGVEEQKDYLKKLSEYRAAVRAYKKYKSKPTGISAYNAMIMDRAAKLPKEERWYYATYKASKDYKNLTPSQIEIYGKAAEEINKSRTEEYKNEDTGLIDSDKRQHSSISFQDNIIYDYFPISYIQWIVYLIAYVWIQHHVHNTS